MFERINRIIDETDFAKLQNLNILLIGIGGVGGYALECFIRSGILNITICDYDVIEESNLNRQIISTCFNVGRLKVEEAKQRALLINPECNIQVVSEKINEESLAKLLINRYDFVIDACDDVRVKTACIIACIDQKIPLISCMGTGNRFHPEMLQITKLRDTLNDPLAKKMRSELRRVHAKYLSVPVLCSTELPVHSSKIGTVCQVPMAAGSLLASFVINKIRKNK